MATTDNHMVINGDQIAIRLQPDGNEMVSTWQPLATTGDHIFIQPIANLLPIRDLNGINPAYDVTFHTQISTNLLKVLTKLEFQNYR